MKGSIGICLKEMIIEKFGQSKWTEILNCAGIQKEPLMTVLNDVDDATIMKIIDAATKVLKITTSQAFDAFSEYWVSKFAPKHYSFYYKGVNNAKDFLLKMDKTHEMATLNIENARPPRFEYEWKNDNTLIMTYKSHRNLVDLFVSLIKAVGRYFNQPLIVNKLSSTKVEIIFTQ